MKAQDTILPYLQVSNQIPMTLLEFIGKLEEQAKISFKAGADEEAKRGIERCLMTYDDGKKAGIREVVGWMIEHNTSPDNVNWITIIKSSEDVNTEDWQSKLREWGL